MNMEEMVNYILTDGFSRTGDALSKLLEGEEISDAERVHMVGFCAILSGVSTTAVQPDLGAVWDELRKEVGLDDGQNDGEGGVSDGRAEHDAGGVEQVGGGDKEGVGEDGSEGGGTSDEGKGTGDVEEKS